MIVGGHRDNFSLPTNLYQLVEAAGIGQTTVMLPDSLRSLLAGAPDVVFVPSSPSGSLGRAALSEAVGLAAENDTLLLAGLSNNSATTIMVESLILHYSTRSFVIADDANEVFRHRLTEIVNDDRCLMVITMKYALRVAGALRLPLNITRSGLAGKLDVMQKIAAESRCSYLIMGSELIVASGGELTVTDLPTSQPANTLVIALAAAFWAQNPTDRLQSLTTAAYVARQALTKLGESASTEQLAKAVRGVLANF